MAALDALQKAMREGKLSRLVNNVESQVKDELGQDAECVLVLVEKDGPAAVTVSVLSTVDEDALPKVLGRALRGVRGDG